MNRPVSVQIDSDHIAWVALDATNPVNLLDPEFFARLDAVFQELARSPVVAVVITSRKDRVFCAGADLRWLAGLANAEEAAGVSRHGQSVLDRIANFKVPVVAALHGVAAGGGCELALSCHWRIATSSRETRLGLPETGLGTLPGWGGCTRLPRLIGPGRALDLILWAQLLPAAEALSVGLVDEVVAPDELVVRARISALRLAADGVPARPAPADLDAATYERLDASVRERTRDRLPAPPAVVALVRASYPLSLTAALDREAQAFGRVTAGPVCKNLIRAFQLREQARKRSLAGWFPDTPATARLGSLRVGVVGAGVMGAGIAHWCALRGHGVMLHDVSPDRIDTARSGIRATFDASGNRGRLSAPEAQAAMERIRPATELEALAGCDLVIEAIVEDVAAKRALFATLAPVVGSSAILASNTSALPMEEIFREVPRPERTLGLHFFNPVDRMPLLEIVLGPATSAETAATALGFVRSLEKSPVICRSSPGFVITRVLFFYLNEACRLWEEGVPLDRIDDALAAWGWPMGPMRLIDEVGVDVTDFIFGELAAYFPDRFRPSRICRLLVQRGHLGRKGGEGSGFYSHQARSETSREASLRPLLPGATSAVPDDAIRDRLIDVLLAESIRCVDEKVVLSADDVDFALLAGAGFPAFRGGLLRPAGHVA